MFNSSGYQKNINNQRGNVFIFILVAIGLLAALTFSLTRSDQEGGKSSDNAQMKLQVTQLLRTAKSLEFAIQKMSLRNGVSENDISFHSGEWGHDEYKHKVKQPEENNVFSSQGGGLSIPSVPQYAKKSETLIAFRGDFGVVGVGSDAPELTFTIEDVDTNFCISVNKENDIKNPSKQPPKDGLSTSEDMFAGIYSDRAGDSKIGDNVEDLKEKKTGCIEDSSGIMVFYHVLVER